jgi:hypothetical protein
MRRERFTRKKIDLRAKVRREEKDLQEEKRTGSL